MLDFQVSTTNKENYNLNLILERNVLHSSTGYMFNIDIFLTTNNILVANASIEITVRNEVISIVDNSLTVIDDISQLLKLSFDWSIQDKTSDANNDNVCTVRSIRV